MKHLSPTSHRQIREFLRNCGQQAAKMAANQFQITEKEPGDYVTSIDQALDRTLSAKFSTLFPDDGVVTEENPLSRQAFQLGYPYLWLIDPLDGTEELIQGGQSYALMVGLMQDYQPIAGWVYAPAQDRLYYGGTALGLFQAIANNPPEPLVINEPPLSADGGCRLVIGDKDKTRYGAAIAQAIPHVQFSCLGSFGLKVMEVVLGRADLYLYLNGRVKLWDTTGPIALAQTAGLVCCDLDANPLEFTPGKVDPETLIHRQPILIGWATHIDAFRSKLQQAVALVS